MKDYKEFQFGWIIFVFVAPVQILLTYSYFNGIGNNPLETNGFIVINLIIMFTYLLFYGMTTRISVDKITVSFGVELIRKNIRLSRVKTAETTRNRWYYGWGIRFIPNGMLYNISGFDGVELKFKDTDKVIRIGTKDPVKLKEQIEKRLRR
jgi:hypothetical protein